MFGLLTCKPSLVTTLVATVAIFLLTATLGMLVAELLANRASVGVVLADVVGWVCFLFFFAPISFGIWFMYLHEDT